MDLVSKSGIGRTLGNELKKCFCILVLFWLLLPPVQGQYYDFEPMQSREIIIDPRNVSGIPKSRYGMIPRPPFYPNGKMCENGQDPWTEAELELLNKERLRIADELRAYDFYPTHPEKLPRAWARSERDYMTIQVDRLFKTRCANHRCVYDVDKMTGICGSTRILTKSSKHILLLLGLFFQLLRRIKSQIRP